MRFLILLYFVFQTNLINAAVVKNAVIRDKHFKAKISQVELVDLIRDDAFEGKYFKIVLGKSDEAISFKENEAIQLKAATTYYHLNIARKFFVEKIKSEYVTNLPQMTIRLELTNVFNEVGHFANNNLDPQFNNALSIPAGKGYAPANIPKWDNEIWFRPSKEINIKDLTFGHDIGPSVKNLLHDFRNQTHNSNFKSFLISFLNAEINHIDINLINTAIRFAESSLLTELIFQTSDFAAEFFSRKIYKLDSALVPEIIYHEFSHIALSDHIELTHSTAVNEGLADYFAGKIANSSELATHINKYNLFSGKEVKNKQMYDLMYEKGEYANADFVFGILWTIGQTIGTDIENNFIYQLSFQVDTNSTIREDLVNASLETCSSECHSPFNDKIKLYKMFNNKGL